VHICWSITENNLALLNIKEQCYAKVIAAMVILAFELHTCSDEQGLQPQTATFFCSMAHQSRLGLQ
jgi:hypothetical protein